MGNAVTVTRKMRIQGVAGSRGLGEAIDQRRFALGFTAQVDLARELGWDKSKLSAIVNGKKGLSGTDVKLLMHELDVPEEWFHDPEVRADDLLAAGDGLDRLRAEALQEHIHYFAHYLATKALKEPAILDGHGPATEAAKAALAEWGRLPAPTPAAPRLERLEGGLEKAAQAAEEEAPEPRSGASPRRRRSARSSEPPSK